MTHVEIDHDHEEVCSFGSSPCVHQLARKVSTKVKQLNEDSLPKTVTSVADEVKQVAHKLRLEEADRQDKVSVCIGFHSLYFHHVDTLT